MARHRCLLVLGFGHFTLHRRPELIASSAHAYKALKLNCAVSNTLRMCQKHGGNMRRFRWEPKINPHPNPTFGFCKLARVFSFSWWLFPLHASGVLRFAVHNAFGKATQRPRAAPCAATQLSATHDASSVKRPIRAERPGSAEPHRGCHPLCPSVHPTCPQATLRSSICPSVCPSATHASSVRLSFYPSIRLSVSVSLPSSLLHSVSVYPSLPPSLPPRIRTSHRPRLNPISRVLSTWVRIHTHTQTHTHKHTHTNTHTHTHTHVTTHLEILYSHQSL